MKKASLLMVVLMMVLNLSCVQPVYQAPYVISKPECIIGEVEGYCKYAGVMLEFYNTADKDITNIQLSFALFDPETKKSSLFGTSHIVTTYDQIIPPEVSTELCISLDSYMYAKPESAFIIENFCITAITYADGSKWTDYFGVHSIDSNGE